MSTSAEIKDARHFKEQLRVLRAQEVNALKRLADSRSIHEANVAVTASTFAVIEKQSNERIAEIRGDIEKVKAVLAIKVHIPTKDEARKIRQDAAKNGRR